MAEGCAQPPRFELETARDQAVLIVDISFAALAPEEIEPRPGYLVTTPLRTRLDTAESAVSQEHLDVAVREALGGGLTCGMDRGRLSSRT